MKKMTILFMAVFLIGVISTAAQAFEIEWNDWKLKPYGYIKADAAYDDSKAVPGEFVAWVDQEMAGTSNDDQFSFTAAQTLLGWKIYAPEYRGINVMGQVEVDFFGVAAAEHEPGLLLRQAFAEVKWERFTLSAGQMSDIIAPLDPDTLNYSVMWWAGNPGYRRPGFKVACTYGGPVKVITELGFFRTVGEMEDAGATYRTGIDAGFPTFQGRLAVQAKLLGDKPFTLGVSGHYGEEEVDFAPKRHYLSWSIVGDLVFPVYDFMTLKGEIWYGANLDAYLAGIGQGINVPWQLSIESTGGWGTITLTFLKDITINLGAGVDAPVPSDLPARAREINFVGFANFIVDITPNAKIGLEYSHWRTDYTPYYDNGVWREYDGDDNRGQLSLILPF